MTIEILIINIWVERASFDSSIIKVKSLGMKIKKVTINLMKTSHFGFRWHIFMQPIGWFWPSSVAGITEWIRNGLFSFLTKRLRIELNCYCWGSLLMASLMDHKLWYKPRKKSQKFPRHAIGTAIFFHWKSILFTISALK